MNGVFSFPKGGSIDGADIGATVPKTGRFTTVTAHEVICTSDARCKREIRTVDDALRTVQKLRGVTWEWDLPEAVCMPVSGGVVAQELAEVVPYAVHARSDGSLGINPNALHGVFIEAIKQLADQNARMERTLQAAVRELENVKKAVFPGFGCAGQQTTDGGVQVDKFGIV
jgi:hypothetical protein